ncbi:hypothetical protein WJX75_002232 [Coccomyxa subellipsoidea]|uniref:Dof-type domain-containing protein n=1 Tax=Coccomyxa subellipsoidea TaxID=248742 RepID=A0ABR2YP39_9CHLO
MKLLCQTQPQPKADKAQATACNESGSPDTREDAGASSGESNTEKAADGLNGKQPGSKAASTAPSAAPGVLALEGGEGGCENAHLGKEGKGDKSMKLPRPEGVARCPRCDSEDTKFCYYNNYNVKQPRYFCKACQRYWTAGGTLRNVPVGAGRRKNKNAAAGEKQKGKVAISEGLDTSGFVPFGPLLGLDQSLGYANPVSAAGKGALGAFMPTLPHLSALAYPPVDPMAAAAAAALPSRLAAGINPAQFCAPSTSQRSGQCAGEDGSRNGRRVRMRKNDGEAARPADSSQHGSASTATEMPGQSADGHGGMARNRGSGEQCMSGGGIGDASNGAGAGNLSSFQPFQGQGFPAAGGAYGQPAMSAPMTADWYSMAAAAGQQQAAAAQQQLQYQAAAAMQAQALQAAAAGWSQGSNPYMSGLCFPYNFYGANPQLAAAYASLGNPQWNTMDVAAAQGAMPVHSNTAGAHGNAAPAPALQQGQQGWGIGQPQAWGGSSASNNQQTAGGGGIHSTPWQEEAAVFTAFQQRIRR